MIFEYIALLTIVLLSAFVIVEDLRKLEIPARAVLGLTAACVLAGIIYPLPGLSPDAALWGAALGLGMGTFTRGYIHWRSGVPAFGGADVSLITAAGGLLGPFLFGPWLLASATIGIAMMLASSVFKRKVDVDGEELEVLPFCPALIISTALAYFLAWIDIIPSGLTG